MKQLIIIGAGGYGRELLQWAKDVQKVKKEWEIAGFIDNKLDALDGYECDYKVLGDVDNWQPKSDDLYVVAIANPYRKRKVVGEIEGRGGRFISIIHPDARIGEFNKIGKGIVMYPNARITVNTTIGDYVTILDNTSVGHDAVIGDYTTICASCGINGCVQIGENSFVGCNVSTVPSIKIGSDCQIGAGSVVVNNIKPNMNVFGNPAKRLPVPKIEK